MKNGYAEEISHLGGHLLGHELLNPSPAGVGIE